MNTLPLLCLLPLISFFLMNFSKTYPRIPFPCRQLHNLQQKFCALFIHVSASVWNRCYNSLLILNICSKCCSPNFDLVSWFGLVSTIKHLSHSWRIIFPFSYLSYFATFLQKITYSWNKSVKVLPLFNVITNQINWTTFSCAFSKSIS